MTINLKIEKLFFLIILLFSSLFLMSCTSEVSTTTPASNPIPSQEASNDIVISKSDNSNPFITTTILEKNLVLTFNTNEGNVTNFSLSLDTSLSPTWPSSWNNNASINFKCSEVQSTGSGCSLTLAYSPVVSEAGVLNLVYSFTNNNNKNITKSLAINYQSIAANSVSGTTNISATNANPFTGVITISQTITITFNTNTGSATALSLSGTLPSGWSGVTLPATNYCASVSSSGSGCTLTLTYTPGASPVAETSFNLGYSYTTSIGNLNSGNNLPIYYQAIAENSVSGATNVSATNATPFIVATNGSKTITLTFNTNAGSATALSLSGTLPSGWSGVTLPATNYCANISSSGSGCTLTLTYAPGASPVTETSFNLGYSYTTNLGNLNSGNNVPLYYQALAANNVSSTTSVSATNATPFIVATNGSKTITLTFNTTAGTATTLSLSGSLPSGWSGVTLPATNYCASISSSGSGCTLTLTYTPGASPITETSFNLVYSYTTNTNDLSSGNNLPIYYQALTANNVSGTNSVSATNANPFTVATSGSNTNTLTFNTNTGSATALSLSGTLPSGWSGVTLPATNYCASISSSGSGCTLTLTYTPGASPVTETFFNLGYSYITNTNDLSSGNNVPLYYQALNVNTVTYTETDASSPPHVIGVDDMHLTFNFQTDAGTASNLYFTSSLPASWSSPATFPTPGGTPLCSSITTSPSACSVTLDFIGATTNHAGLSLGYTYINNVGATISTTATSTYAAEQVNSLTTNTGATTFAISVNEGSTGNVSFDLEPTPTLTTIQSISLSSSTPTDVTAWSVGSVSCTDVTGAGCLGIVTFAPVKCSASSSAVVIDYSYVNNAGTSSTLVITIDGTKTSPATPNVLSASSVSMAASFGPPSTSSISFSVNFGSVQSIAVSSINLTPSSGCSITPTTCTTFTSSGNYNPTISCDSSVGAQSGSVDFTYINDHCVSTTLTVSVTITP